MSRAEQPQLHMHMVAANPARGADGRLVALHGYPIFQHAKAAGSLCVAAGTKTGPLDALNVMGLGSPQSAASRRSSSTP